MHEVAIIRDIINTLQAHHADKLDKIVKVQVQAGLLCNVQPVLIQNAFEAMIYEEPWLQQIDLEVITLPIVAYCQPCHTNFDVKWHRFVCPLCSTTSNKIIQGEELRISKVEYLTD